MAVQALVELAGIDWILSDQSKEPPTEKLDDHVFDETFDLSSDESDVIMTQPWPPLDPELQSPPVKRRRAA